MRKLHIKLESTKILSILFLLALFLNGCTSEKQREQSVVIALPSDVKTFSPIYAMNAYEGNITEQIFLGLAGHRWLEDQNKIESYPVLAEEWKWNKDSNFVTIKLRNDVYWDDSIKFTADDVLFTFDVYSDPEIQSRFYGYFENYFTNEDLSIDLKKSFEVFSPDSLRINFRSGTYPSVFDFDLPILPKHKYQNIQRQNFITAPVNTEPVGTGPYTLSSWKRDETISLKLREKSFLTEEESIPRIIFKVIPDYRARLIQLETGELDFVEEIKPGDVEEVKNYENVKVELQQGRDYDYVGWNNIDPALFAENGKIESNKFFGSSRVRKALTHAINRKLLVEEFLNNYGEVAVGSVSPIFKEEYNSEIEPYKFDPEEAKKILASEGWEDKNNDGIIEKDNLEFSFTLSIPGGNPRRSSVATVIKENLKNIGIEANIETLEPSVFFNKMFSKQLEAWIAGWSVPIPLDLKPYWHSDLESSVANVVTFQDKEVDDLLEKVISDEQNRIEYLKKLQTILHEEQPVTFLYWIDNIIAYNENLQNVKINPLGTVQKCWEWRMED